MTPARMALLLNLHELEPAVLCAALRRVINATAVICSLLLLTESRFRRLDAPELLKEVLGRVTFVDGVATATMPQAAVT